ncbi:Gfo/Idh/MocA family oxidoreductase [Pannus brasiliensis CCIBt3594]|uniref:Gfo/Idh/MocA family oxidoreductase n=2 Tax=Pannus TaxID=1427526 RepID=A0AAW9QI22_9CHRO
MSSPLKVGIVGTGYAAARRAESLQADERSRPLYVSGHSPESLDRFCRTHDLTGLDWRSLVTHPDLDLVVIANINRDHGSLVRAALESGKHVIVEYPLTTTPEEGRELIEIAEKQKKLLHVEHIELLGGLHRAQQQHLPEIGTPFHARYATVVPQNPVPRRWTFHRELFGFPSIAALSRIHRLTNLFGSVVSVSCQNRYWDAPEEGYFLACLCEAKLLFSSGLMAGITYGKGEVFHKSDRTFEIHGDRGSLVFDGEEGQLIRGEESRSIEVGSRRGLFTKDTTMVLDYLFDAIPLYVTPRESLYALEVAHACYQSSITGQTVLL